MILFSLGQQRTVGMGETKPIEKVGQAEGVKWQIKQITNIHTTNPKSNQARNSSEIIYFRTA